MRDAIMQLQLMKAMVRHPGQGIASADSISNLLQPADNHFLGAKASHASPKDCQVLLAVESTWLYKTIFGSFLASP